MTTQCKDCPLRTKPLFQGMSEEEAQQTQRFKSGELVVDPGTPLMLEGSNAPQLYTALRGMGIRYKTLPNGRRQVINLIFPGDFIGLQAGIMGEMSHSVEATTKMTLCVFDRKAFFNFFRSNTERAFDITWLAAVEEHFLGEALTTVGQRSAESSVAWAMLKVYHRCDALGLAQDRSMPFPFRQQDLADALGLSLVHTNKTLSKLRDAQMARWSDGELNILNYDRLAELAMMQEEEARPRPLI
ncbi:Crp/Fnr family transcriptional regulator [Thalassococcus sp. S3]|uniref:Crp/Fnr family transcriptional regulator n=1 Tax=Thalassococcus sp. S3 TaxID=2017482 RepID=UPI0010243B17|nr:Crp/Fnr family transcriptional regulator [Thalassococcus sp. S3]QBF29960.1 Crp/Fnr family transcriptional regulator [Thalassococcus sp. S3]